MEEHDDIVHLLTTLRQGRPGRAVCDQQWWHGVTTESDNIHLVTCTKCKETQEYSDANSPK